MRDHSKIKAVSFLIKYHASIIFINGASTKSIKTLIACSLMSEKDESAKKKT